MKKLLAFFLVVLSAIAFNRCKPYDTVTSSAPAIVPVTEVTLDKTTLTLEVGNTGALTAKVKPDDVNQAVTWSSEPEAVATVDDEGVVKAVKAGKATITVTMEDGNKTATCTVKVIPVGTRTFTVGEGENPVTFNMVPVEAGTFQMGSNAGYRDEKPVHQVKLTQDYYIGEYEVTQGLWQAVMGNNPSNFKNGDDYPVEKVSWDNIQNFLTTLNSELSSKLAELGSTMHFALPTEAQWEFAAAGGKAGYNADYTRKHTYSGSDTVDDVAWYSNNCAVDRTKQTHPVGRKQPNELGIYDMSGNVYEWCADWYKADYYAVSPEDNPQGPPTGSHRVLRGGGWIYLADLCAVSSRDFSFPDYNNRNYGFRLALLPC